MDIEERLNTYFNQKPSVHAASFVAASADICGAVTLGMDSSVWYQCVLRADINPIQIGAGTNIQDGTVIHLADDFGVEIGEYTTVGHQAMIHACTIGDECLIGMGATILDGARIGNQCIIGAHALVTKAMDIPDGSLVFGAPARIIKPLDTAEREEIRSWAEKYIHVARRHALRALTLGHKK
jgi:carbonic anhydrase/acetyltransferase-like protein (isoleucine patch superfamily)